MASLLVPLSGVLSFVGGLSILLGYKTSLGAWMLVAFLLPVTLMMHAFWKASDPLVVHTQQAMFMKNVALLGAALLIAQCGAGALSLDGWGR